MNVINEWLNTYSELLNPGVPGIYQIYKEARIALELGETDRVRELENLIYFLHNSVVSAKTDIRDNVEFAYGGISLVIHKDATILEGSKIGQGVTIGGGSKFRLSLDGKKRLYIPLIGRNVYLATGCKIIGGIKVGDFSIIGANTVVTKNVLPFSIIAGNPMKIINTISEDNCLKYKGLFHFSRKLSNDEFIDVIKKEKAIIDQLN